MQNNEIFKSYSELMKRAKDPFDSMWQSEWKDIFNEEVNYVLFFSHSQSDEVEIELKKLLFEIKKIHSKIAIGNDFEIQFLAYYCLIEQTLNKNFDIKEPYKYDIYRIAYLKLMREWFNIRRKYIEEKISRFASYGKPNEFWDDYIKAMKDRIDGNNRGKDRSIEELRYEMFLPHLKGKIKIPMEQYLELQKELGKINIFLKKSLEVMKKTETTVTEKDGFRCYYKESWFEHQVVSVERERRLTAILETSFLPKENRFSKYIQGFNEIKNQILSLGCNDTNEKTSLLFQQAEYRESKYPQKFKS